MRDKEFDILIFRKILIIVWKHVFIENYWDNKLFEILNLNFQILEFKEFLRLTSMMKKDYIV